MFVRECSQATQEITIELHGPPTRTFGAWTVMAYVDGHLAAKHIF